MTNQIVAAVLGGVLCLCTGLIAGYMMGYWSASYDARQKGSEK